MKNIVSFLIAIVVMSFLPYATQGQDMRISSKVVRKSYSGFTTADRQCQETVSIEGTTLTISRTGGVKVAKGPYTLHLSDQEIQTLNKILATIDPVNSADNVTRNGVEDAGKEELAIGSTMLFQKGWVSASYYHEFSKQVSALFWAIQEIMKAHQLDKTTNAGS